MNSMQRRKKMTIKPQLKPHPWACSITSLAMAIGVPVIELMALLGHDGSEVIWPNLPEPSNHRGFHSQELVHLAWRFGYTMTTFDVFPYILPTSGPGDPYPVILNDDENANWHQFFEIIENRKGIIEGRSGRWHHSMCFDHGEIFNPDGGQFSYTRRESESRGFYSSRAHVLIRR
jgi:hypothetical protein